MEDKFEKLLASVKDHETSEKYLAEAKVRFQQRELKYATEDRLRTPTWDWGERGYG